MALDDTSTTPSPTSTAPRIVSARSIARRKRLERLTYSAATLGLAVGPHSGFWPAHLGAAALGVAAARHLWRQWDDEPLGWNLLKTAQRLTPALTGSAAYLAPLCIPGSPWWEWLLAPAWGAAMTYTTPLTHSADLTPEHFQLALPQLAPIPQQQAPASYPAYRVGQWDLARTTGTTRLTSVTQYTDPAGQLVQDFWGIVIAEAGEAVPDLNATALAAVFDLPPGTVELHLIKGSGPGRKLLTAKPTLQALEQATDPIQRLWNEKLARPGGPTEGMTLDAYKADDNRIALRTSAPENQIIQLNQKLIARALNIADLTLVMVETDGLGDGLISIYKQHPLMNVREATVEDLTMAPDGTIALGQQPDGRIGRVPLYDPQVGAITDLYVGAPGAGKSVTLLHVIAAERLSGIVSIVADAQEGMSLPEVEGRVYHFGKGIAATAATLAAGHDLGKYREQISAENGWGSFEIGNPWPLVNLTLDELNCILSADAVVPRPFRKWVTGLVGNTQSTGRKLGEGIRFAAQSIHLADLGDKDRIRANAKNGTVWLGRTNSSTTQHMARDGVLPPGIELAPIPRYFGSGGSTIDAAFQGKEAKRGPVTAGMANIINGGSLFVNRTWYARKENKTYPHLIKLMESRPMPCLTEQEAIVFGLSYQRWLAFAEALLAGEGEEGINDAVAAEQAVVSEQSHLWQDDNEAEGDAPSGGTIKDRILDLLSDGQPWPLKDVRKHLDDMSPASVNNAMAELRGDGHVTAVSRGTYQIVN